MIIWAMMRFGQENPIRCGSFRQIGQNRICWQIEIFKDGTPRDCICNNGDRMDRIQGSLSPNIVKFRLSACQDGIDIKPLRAKQREKCRCPEVNLKLALSNRKI